MIGKACAQGVGEGVVKVGEQRAAARTLERGQVGGLKGSVVEEAAGLDEGSSAGVFMQEAFNAQLEEQLVAQFRTVAPVWVGGQSLAQGLEEVILSGGVGIVDKH